MVQLTQIAQNTTVSFEYGPTTEYGRTVNATPGTVTGASNTTVSAGIENLIPNTTYHFRAVGAIDDEIVYGEDMTFITGSGPQVTTNVASEIGTIGATLNGLVNANDMATTVTFEYGLTLEYGTMVDADQSPVSGSTNTVVSKTLISLTPSTTYNFRVVGQNTGGTTYGTNRTFTTAATNPDAPIATTNGASGSSSSGATLNGTVDPKNKNTVVHFEYGWTTAYGDTLFADQSPIIGEFPIGVSAPLTGLMADTSYHYRVVAQNDFGAAYGNDMTIYTVAPVTPTVTTENVSDVTTGSAKLNATINPNNSFIAQIYFEHGLTQSYGNIIQANPFTVSGLTNSLVSADISGLSTNRTYHYRVRVQSEFGFTYGANQTFTTNLPPTVSTDSVSAIGSTSATLHGTVNANNTTIKVTFDYGFSTSFGGSVEADQSPVSDSLDVAVTKTLTDLQPNSRYYFRAVAQNTEIVFGWDMTFTTDGLPPEASTDAANSVTSSGATLNGTTKANNDNSNITFEYGLTDEYGTTISADQSPVTGNAITKVSKAITGLTDNTTYHYRVVAQNSFGTTNGSDKTFFTGAIAPNVITNTATEISSTTATLNGTVIANNAATNVYFEFGPDTSYGRTISATPNTLSGSINTEVYAQLTQLIQNTTYHYRIIAENNAGTAIGEDETFVTLITALEDDNFSIPTKYDLLQNYPNPFNPVTTISYELPKQSFVQLSIYNMKGQLIETLVNKNQNTGYYTIQWDAANVSSGIYLYKLISGNHIFTRKMVVLK